MALKHKNLVGVTAAMAGGTGLDKLIEKFPNRFWDVSIAEQHAVTSMAAISKEGFKPFITIYSTFLQRGFDQIIHDVCIMNLPVVFAIDRAGIVGNDGETHQGAFDISYLRLIPNMTLFAPRDNKTLEYAIKYAYEFTKGPCSFRYPRGSFKELEYTSKSFEYGKSELLKEGKSNKLLVGYGAGVSRAIETQKLHNEDLSILDLRFVKPLDEVLLKKLSKRYTIWYIFSDSSFKGGVATAILEFFSINNINIKVVSFEYDDFFIEHGDTIDIEENLGLLPSQLVTKI